MVSFPCVHHIEVGVVDGPGAVNILTSQYTFTVTAVRHTEVADQWLLVKNNTRFLITTLKKVDRKTIEKDDFLVNWGSTGGPSDPGDDSPHPKKDAVFNVAFQIKNIDGCIQRLQKRHVAFTKQCRTVTDPHGSLKTCTIKSCVGDIHHTLIQKDNYSGYFLPGFTQVAESDGADKNDNLLASFDHVAFAVKMNTAMSVIEWYEECLGMRRFLINREESEEEGLVLSTDNVGLRLRAMEYWKCAEVGLVTPQEEGVTSRLSIVVAEGLPPVPGSKEDNQVESWIKQHGGPGIQHVAITSHDIKTTVKNLKLSGAVFANPPPPAYYSELGRLQDILQAGEDAEELKQHGILIDTDADGIHDSAVSLRNGIKRENYLLQIFTKPVFDKDPFFLEIIQREGATGFGSGNVAALYRSVQAYIVGQRNNGRM